MDIKDVEWWEHSLHKHALEPLKLLPKDFDSNKDDPLFFPAKLELEELKQLPPTVLQTSEFDPYRRDVLDTLKPKMVEAGIFLDMMNYKGLGLAFHENIDEPATQTFFEDLKKTVLFYM